MSPLIIGLFAQSLGLPREMRSQFVWSNTQKTIRLRRINPQNIKYMLRIIFFACLDLEQKSSLINRLIHAFPENGP
jgi:hypothetical protein